MLSNAYFLAKFRFDTAEDEPAKNLQNFRKMHFSKNAFFEKSENREVATCRLRVPKHPADHRMHTDLRAIFSRSHENRHSPHAEESAF